MTEQEHKLLIQSIGHITKAIEKQTKAINELKNTIVECSKNTIEVSLNSRINDNYVFVTKMHIDKITEQSVIDNYSLMLKSLGHVLLTMQDELETKDKQ